MEVFVSEIKYVENASENGEIVRRYVIDEQSQLNTRISERLI